MNYLLLNYISKFKNVYIFTSVKKAEMHCLLTYVPACNKFSANRKGTEFDGA